MRKGLFLLFILLSVTIFLSGCIQNIGAFSGFAQDYANNLKRVDVTPAEKECQLGNCTCIVCRNGPSIWSPLSSLAGGYCKIDNECNTTKFNDYNNPEKLGANFSVRKFMIGQGPSISDATAANRLCNNGLSMAVQWLIGSENRSYDDVDVNRIICLLDKGMLPVFVLYSKGQNINATRAGEIAYKIGHEAVLIRRGSQGPAGPVIIISELEFNSSDQNAVESVAAQINEINKKCGNSLDPYDPKIYCFAGIAPKIGDTQGLDKVMRVLNTTYGYSKEDLSKFVVLAYGLNSHYVNGTCSGSRMLLDAYEFSRYARNNYSIPSIIPYVLIDVGQPDVSGRCIWREGDAVTAYNFIFQNSVSGLIENGVMGIALYSPEANDFSNPLGCKDCGVVQHEMRKRAWFGNCQKFTTTTYTDQQTSETVAHPVNLLRFPNNDAADCGTGLEEVAASTFNVRLFKNTGGNSPYDIFNPPTPEMQAEVEMLWSCSSCISERKNLTELFKETGGGDVIKKKKQKPSVITGDVCNNYSELDFYASRFNVDPMLVRATAAAESGFNKCAIARVCRDSQTASQYKCVPGNYWIGYEFMEDPSGECTFEKIQADNQGYLPYTFVGLGLMQVLESPYTFWPPNGKYYEDYFKVAKGYERSEDIDGVKAVCGDKFNPFNATDAACWGTAKLSKFISSKDTHDEARALAVNSSNPDEVSVLSALIGEYKYMGWWYANASKAGLGNVCTGASFKKVGQCLIAAYKGSSVTNCEPTSEGGCPDGCASLPGGGCDVDEVHCYFFKDKPKDFIWFMDCLINRGLISSDNAYYPKSGLMRLGYYEWLNENCEQASCPSWAKLNSELNEYGGKDKKADPYSAYEDYYAPQKQKK